MAKVSEKQRAVLAKWGFTDPESMTYDEIDAAFAANKGGGGNRRPQQRRPQQSRGGNTGGGVTPKQAEVLRDYGQNPANYTKSTASEFITQVAAQGWPDPSKFVPAKRRPATTPDYGASNFQDGHDDLDF